VLFLVARKVRDAGEHGDVVDCGAECGEGKHTGSGEHGGSTLATWCSWMEVSMPGLKDEGREVA
jgi:hypothetical protein